MLDNDDRVLFACFDSLFENIIENAADLNLALGFLISDSKLL